MLAIGAYFLKGSEAISRVNFTENDDYPYSFDDEIEDYLLADHGDYQITFTGPVSNVQAVGVPEPSTWALGAFALACGGWQLTRRRRALRVKA